MNISSTERNKSKILFLFNNFNLIPTIPSEFIISVLKENSLFKKYKIQQCSIKLLKIDADASQYIHCMKEKRRQSPRLKKNIESIGCSSLS